MWDGAMEETTEMLSMSRPLPSTVIVGVPARKYISKKKKKVLRSRSTSLLRISSVFSVFLFFWYMECKKGKLERNDLNFLKSLFINIPIAF